MITSESLHAAFYEVVGPIDAYILKLRTDPEAKNQITRNQLKAMFKGMTLWKKAKKGSGHIKYKHAITGITVSFQGHVTGKMKLSTITAEQATGICTAFQNHVNILGNDIFRFTLNNWSFIPNLDVAVKNYANWRKKHPEIESEDQA